jgi:hypothetical protein
MKEKRREKKLQKKQSRCNHNELTDWINEVFAPGYIPRYSYQRCKECEKIVNRKGLCNACNKEFIISDEKYKSLPPHDVLCMECLKKGKRYCDIHDIFFDDRCPKCEEEANKLSSLTAEEEKAVKDRLRKLGYL